MRSKYISFLLLILFILCFACVEETRILVCGDCDDGNPCTKDYCNKETGACIHEPISGNISGCYLVQNCSWYSCVNGSCILTPLYNCCGNNICELNENCSTCGVDCGSCIEVESLMVPIVPSYLPYEIPKKPEVNTAKQIPINLTFFINAYKIYNASGGVLEIRLRNNDPIVYVCNLKVITNYAEFSELPGAWIVNSSEEKRLGMLLLQGPKESGNYTYKICGNIISMKGGLAYEYKDVCTQEMVFKVFDLPIPSGYSLEYDNLLSKRISSYLDDSEEIRKLINESAAKFPGGYNIYQICYLFDWVRENIKYVRVAQFANASEVMRKKIGDCKHFSILLTTFIKDLGGASRIFLTEDHMFTTFFAGNSTTFSKIKNGIRSYYGDLVPVYYIKDENGYWIILDATCSNYVGGLPCDSIPFGENFMFVNLTTLKYTEVYR